MIPKERVKRLVRRLVVMLVLFGIAAIFHRIGAYFNKDIIGAIVFIVLFSAAILYYYLSLFTRKKVYRGDYFLGIAFTFFLTVTMFAIIYAEPINDGMNYFLVYGKMQNLSISDAVYFSTTTITTLGMGDITPVGVFRYMVMIEVILGLLYAGSMVYFITREFEER